ncbi:AarF/ABC1/UbiB kinase family protein [uncultured Planktomarina sp.]|jgi:predicted unusual protein kinase regulating ubiquinone biosynthesis (AarF/ABC1/UbiB family)|uniref:ABC1 kinase family protein n=1 Tax=uncultured Planktomarina sp. TaxID=1538529 RepID=UPI00325FE5EA
MKNSHDKDDVRSISVPARRIERLGKLGSLTAGVASSMALNGVKQLAQGKRPSLPNLLLTPSNVKRVSDQLAQMRGAAMKIGQLMSMDAGDVLPPELSQILVRLRDNAHPMPPAQLKRVLNAEWPAQWLRSFHKFDVQPIAAASIGQVHRGQLTDGRDLAIKVQYPGVAKSIDSDIANVGVLMRMSGLLPKGFELASYLEEGRKQLHEETNYNREATQLKRFGDLLADKTQFVVPEIHGDWSTANILTMTYVAGVPIESVAEETQEIRDQVAKDLIDLTIHELFSFGVMQTDPNFANYLYQPDNQRIVLLDFGATHKISPPLVQIYHQLMLAGLSGDDVALEETIKGIGFIDENTKDSQRKQIVHMVKLVFDTLQNNRYLDFADTKLATHLQDSAMALAKDGFLPPPLPIDVLLLQRKFGGMFLLAAKLAARVDVVSLLADHLKGTALHNKSKLSDH